MPSRIATDDVLADIDKALKVWKANPTMTIINLTPADVEVARDGMATLDATLRTCGTN